MGVRVFNLHPPGKPITSDTFSLLKFLQPDDLSLDCLAVNMTGSSKYLTTFPVDCSAKIANSVFCVENNYDCKRLCRLTGTENVAR